MGIFDESLTDEDIIKLLKAALCDGKDTDENQFEGFLAFDVNFGEATTFNGKPIGTQWNQEPRVGTAANGVRVVVDYRGDKPQVWTAFPISRDPDGE